MASREQDEGGDFAEVVAALYEAATDASLWTRFLSRFGQATGSSVLTLHMHDLRDDRIVELGTAVGCDAAAEEAYKDYFVTRNVWLRAAEPVMRTGWIGTGSQALPPSELKRTEYFDGWLRRIGVVDAVSACILREESLTARLEFLRPGPSYYGAREVAFTRRLMPHLQRALSIHRRLHAAELQKAGAEHALDALSFGVCLLDERRCVVFVNRSGRALLAAADGLSLTRDGRLAAAGPERKRLELLIADACATGSGRGLGPGGGVAVARPSGRRALSVVAAPLRLRELSLLPGIPVAAVFISDSEREVSARTVLREVYGFTAAEAAVANLMLEGFKVEEIADRQEVSTATVRTHVRRLLEKAGARGQADLLRILLSGPAALLLEGLRQGERRR